jgi:lysyl endopeptidase
MSHRFERSLLGLLLVALASSPHAAGLAMGTTPAPKSQSAIRSDFRFPEVAAGTFVRLGPLPGVEKSGAGKSGRPANKVGDSRESDVASLPAAETVLSWSSVGGGHVARAQIASEGAFALRAGLRIRGKGTLEIRVMGSDSHPRSGEMPNYLSAEWLRAHHPGADELVWTPVTFGAQQTIEVWAAGNSPPSIRLENVSHLFSDPTGPAAAATEKALSCNVNFSCSTDQNLLNTGKSVARMLTTKSGSSYVCSGALLNNTGTVQNYFATAFHCVNSQAEATATQYLWYNEQLCNSTQLNALRATTIGSQFIRTSRENDFTLLRTSGTLPAGLILLGWDPAPMAAGQAVYGVHHPAGDPKAYSVGTSPGRQTSSALLPDGNVLTVNGYEVDWQVGVTEPGSSGSPLMTGAGILRGTLSQVQRNSNCTNARSDATYTNFSLVYPLVSEYLNPTAAQADDFPNTAVAAQSSAPLDTAFLKVRLNSAADQDWFRFVLPEPGVWILYTRAEPGASTVDTRGRIYASDGTTLLAENDDDENGTFGLNFFFYLRVTTPGTFYLQVTGVNGATGPFELVSLYDANDDHSDLYFLGTPLSSGVPAAGSLERRGDTDYFTFQLSQASPVTISSSGGTDLVGVLRNANLDQIATNDDLSSNDVNFRISTTLQPGRYYVQVVGYDVATTGPYAITATLGSATATNYTALWYNAAESGWGINFNHQGDILFGTLFTYAADRAGMWLVAPSMTLQSDGSFAGGLFRTTGPPFFTVPWTAISATQVGNLSARFTSASAGSISYTVNGVAVSKAIERQVFSTPPTCTFTSASRAGSRNYQDLWWNSNESGWGINLAHQGSTIFATLFTYTNTGRDGWLVAPSLAQQADGRFTGSLYVTTGPPFNSLPWSAISATDVGTMTLAFQDGENGTLTYTVLGTTVNKGIRRQTFGATQPLCN